LQGHALQSLAERLMASHTAATEPASEAGPELRDLLNRMLIERLKEQETEAIAAATSDPKALERYRELRDRRLQMVKNQTEGIIPP
jgi:DNA primase